MELQTKTLANLENAQKELNQVRAGNQKGQDAAALAKARKDLKTEIDAAEVKYNA